MSEFEIGQTVEIKEFRGSHRGWTFKDAEGGVATGMITGIDEHCLTVRRDDNLTTIRDVYEHFRPLQ